MKCPNCKAESTGRFCSSCGTPLNPPAHCSSCGKRLAPGAAYCTHCGEPAGGGRKSAINVPWLIAGGALVIAIIAILYPTLQSNGGAGSVPSAAAPFAGSTTGGQLPALSGTPREQADRLFNRIMQERSQGNDEQARFFVPMALQAYEASAPLDADGLYHLSLIQAVGQDYPAARATAERILQASPNHLLGLAALAEAAMSEGDTAAALAAYGRYLDNFDAEQAKQLTEYMDHAPILGQYADSARVLLGR